MNLLHGPMASMKGSGKLTDTLGLRLQMRAQHESESVDFLIDLHPFPHQWSQATFTLKDRMRSTVIWEVAQRRPTAQHNSWAPLG